MSVNYGMVEETRRLGVAFKLVEAGGYPNLERQRAQIRQCVASGADVLVVGDGLVQGTDRNHPRNRQGNSRGGRRERHLQRGYLGQGRGFLGGYGRRPRRVPGAPAPERQRVR